MNDAKGVWPFLSSKAKPLCGLEHLAKYAGCCGVIEPDLSSTLDKTVCSLFLSYHGTFVMTIIFLFFRKREREGKSTVTDSLQIWKILQNTLNNKVIAI
jgi:uncharacterized membrane protein YwaF